jgi:hypothetical protein
LQLVGKSANGEVGLNGRLTRIRQSNHGIDEGIIIWEPRQRV